MLTGGCHCGAIRYEVEGEPQHSALCHCSDCRRHFCPACGTGLFYTNDQIFPGQTDVQSATLDTPEALPPTARIQVAERIAWVEDADALPAFQRYPGMD